MESHKTKQTLSNTTNSLLCMLANWLVKLNLMCAYTLIYRLTLFFFKGFRHTGKIDACHLELEAAMRAQHPELFKVNDNLIVTRLIADG